LKTQIDDKTVERDLELENIVGNLLIAEYQVEKLRGRVVDIISKKSVKASSYLYKYNDKWYRVLLSVEEELGIITQNKFE
jgi:hypothetical protein